MDAEEKYTYFMMLCARNIKDGTNIEKSISDYKKYVKIIEQTNEEKYENDLVALEENYKIAEEIYTIEQERDRLITLIELIENRIKQRAKIKKEYNKLLKPYDRRKDWFFNELEIEIPIKSANNLEEYKNKLELVKNYLKRIQEIISLKEKNNIDEIRLQEEELIQNKNKETNNILEEDLSNFFDENIGISNELILELEQSNIKEIENIYVENIKLKEDRILKKLNAQYKANKEDKKIKEQLNKEREELKELKIKHFLIHDKFVRIALFVLVQNKNNDFEYIKNKREEILNILEKRENLIKKYRLKENDNQFYQLEVLIHNQLQKINTQEKNNSLVKKLKESINNNNQKIIELENKNLEPEYYNLISQFFNKPEEMPQEEETNNDEEILEETKETNVEDENKSDMNNLTDSEVLETAPDISYETNKDAIQEASRVDSNSGLYDIIMTNLPQFNLNDDSNAMVENNEEYESLSDDETEAYHQEEIADSANEKSDKNSLENSNSTPEENNLDKYFNSLEQKNHLDKHILKTEEAIDLDKYLNNLEPKNNLDSFVPKSEEENNLDSFVPESKEEKKLDDYIPESEEDFSNDALDDLINRAVASGANNNANKEVDSETNTNDLASIVTAEQLPEQIDVDQIKTKGKNVLARVIEQFHIANGKSKRRVPNEH